MPARSGPHRKSCDAKNINRLRASPLRAVVIKPHENYFIHGSPDFDDDEPVPNALAVIRV
jgi:hypothetical protein